jgi:hypothetical protein
MKTKEKIIQIAFASDAMNPVLLTNKGRVIKVVISGTQQLPVYAWRDITPFLDKIPSASTIKE